MAKQYSLKELIEARESAGAKEREDIGRRYPLLVQATFEEIAKALGDGRITARQANNDLREYYRKAAEGNGGEEEEKPNVANFKEQEKDVEEVEAKEENSRKTNVDSDPSEEAEFDVDSMLEDDDDDDDN